MMKVELVKYIDAVYILLIFLGIYTIIDIILYTILVKYGTKQFNRLSV